MSLSGKTFRRNAHARERRRNGQASACPMVKGCQNEME